jgi:hypothetical protein
MRGGERERERGRGRELDAVYHISHLKIHRYSGLGIWFRVYHKIFVGWSTMRYLLGTYF